MPMHHSIMPGSHKTEVTEVGSLLPTCGFQASIQVNGLGGKHFYLPPSLLIGQMTLNFLNCFVLLIQIFCFSIGLCTAN